ncbi:25022_t:CDS:2 [Gigaspora margarita]|uniref:25022_t:CDS:1 n=1 Tax=Gigaspora margarita TaxID=4874 RepID=A0ABN7UT18_GIGMA|nr:25022_t:CDS:2 [Gigaspora margarita]
MTLPYQHNNSPFVSSMMSPPPSPKKSVDINTLENLEKPALSREINTLSILNETTTKEQPKEQTKELVKPKSRPKTTVNQVPKPKPKNEHMTGDNHMTIIQKSNHRNHHHRIRKNPYPIKSPTKSSPGITLKLDVFTPFKEDPMALLHINKPYQTLTSECRQPLTISHLPHFNALHRKEVEVASTLRLTPVQYLTAKHTLVSAAQRYVQKSLPFRKSDAQKLLRIDVNKASKLWEFFQQVKWI